MRHWTRSALAPASFALFTTGCFPLTAGWKHNVMASAQPPPDAKAVLAPPGYGVSLVVTGLTFPTGVTVSDDGRIWVVEAGYSYGDAWTEPRLVTLNAEGSWDVVATGTDAPWTGVTAHEDTLYVVEGGISEGGAVLAITMDGAVSPLVTGLPGHGDHHSNGPAVGPDGWIYFSQGTATNSAIVGVDNDDYGWLARRPGYHDTPCADVVLRGVNARSLDPLTEAPHDRAVTGAFVPFGTPTKSGQRIPGAVPCNGAVMRVRPEGGPIELVAWGFRNPFGLAFAPDGRLFVTDNAYDERGSRPVFGAGDVLWEVRPGAWYGWPDFAEGKPIYSARFDRPFAKRPQRLLKEHPGTPPEPAAIFGVHASANGLAFSPPGFGFPGEAFVAEWGDMAPAVGETFAPVGRRVVRVDVETGAVTAFLTNRAEAGGGLHRPIAVAFDPRRSAMYVLDFGVMGMAGGEPVPVPGSGALWRVEHTP
jgi:glucose/arabinose dehydrogenase